MDAPTQSSSSTIPSLEQLRRQLPLLCRQVRWTEWEVLSILAGLPPTPPEDAPAKPRQQLVDEAAHRAAVRRQLVDEAAHRRAVRRHVDDAIAEGELRVNRNLSHLEQVKGIDDSALQKQLENAVYANTLYGQRYTVKPSVVIRWFLERRELFPDCPLEPKHFAFAEETRSGAAEVGATTLGQVLEEEDPARAALRRHRYALLDRLQQKLGLPNREALCEHLKMGRSTLEAIVRDESHKAGRSQKMKLRRTLVEVLAVSQETWNRPA